MSSTWPGPTHSIRRTQYHGTSAKSGSMDWLSALKRPPPHDTNIPNTNNPPNQRQRRHTTNQQQPATSSRDKHSTTHNSSCSHYDIQTKNTLKKLPTNKLVSTYGSSYTLWEKIPGALGKHALRRSPLLTPAKPFMNIKRGAGIGFQQAPAERPSDDAMGSSTVTGPTVGLNVLTREPKRNLCQVDDTCE